MMPGDLVKWRFHFQMEMNHFQMDLPGDIGIILEPIPYESRNNDPFPFWKVLFGNRGVLKCRESDIVVIHENR